MKPIQFTIHASNHGRKRAVKVFVYPTLTHLYAATEKYNKLMELENFSRDYLAITHSFEAYKIEKDGSEFVYNKTNIIRLSKDYLSSYIIVHEIIHAALHIYSLDCLDEADPLLDHMNPGNEIFCHLVSELEHNIINKLHAAGLYD